jgi:hypothetical protein
MSRAVRLAEPDLWGSDRCLHKTETVFKDFIQTFVSHEKIVCSFTCYKKYEEEKMP